MIQKLIETLVIEFLLGLTVKIAKAWVRSTLRRCLVHLPQGIIDHHVEIFEGHIDSSDRALALWHAASTALWGARRIACQEIIRADNNWARELVTLHWPEDSETQGGWHDPSEENAWRMAKALACDAELVSRLQQSDNKKTLHLANSLDLLGAVTVVAPSDLGAVEPDLEAAEPASYLNNCEGRARALVEAAKPSLNDPNLLPELEGLARALARGADLIFLSRSICATAADTPDPDGEQGSSLLVRAARQA